MNNETNYLKEPSPSLVGPEIAISCVSNLFIRMMTFAKRGTVELGHSHIFDHTTFISNGSFDVQIYDEEKREFLPPVNYKAPAMVYIRKNVVHQLTATDDNSIALCIHALRDENDDILDPGMVPIPMSHAASAKWFDELGISVKDVVCERFKVEEDLKEARIDRYFDPNKAI